MCDACHGFGAKAPLAGEVSIRNLTDALTVLLSDNGLLGIDAVGSSMGARLMLELARRGGVLGGAVSLDPGGFARMSAPVLTISVYSSA